MSQMNAGIILGARQPDLVNAFAQGQALRAQSNQLADQNALRNLYQTQGANIFAGDQNALNSLAQIDPAQALAIRGQHQVQGQRDQTMQMRIAEYAKTISKEQAAAEAAKLEQGIVSAIGMYQAGDLDGLNALLKKAGIPPIPSVEAFPPLAAQFGDALETLKSVTEFSTTPEPEWRVATPEEALQYGAKAGQINAKTGEFKRTPTDKTMQITSDGQGGFTLTEGSGELPKRDLTSTNKTQAQKVEIAAQGLSNAFDRYEAIVNQHGAELLPGGAKDALQEERRNIQLEMKELFNLGVLNGPDLDLMNQMMLDPTDPLTVAGGVVSGVMGGGDIKSRTLDNIKRLRVMFDDKKNNWLGTSGKPTEAGGSGSGAFQFQNDQQRQLFEKYRVPSAE